MTVYRSSRNIFVNDDGTNYEVTHHATKLCEFRKSDNQLKLEAGVDTDQSL